MLYDQSLFASVLLLFDVKLLYIDPNCWAGEILLRVSE